VHVPWQAVAGQRVAFTLTLAHNVQLKCDCINYWLIDEQLYESRVYTFKNIAESAVFSPANSFLVGFN
jgi:hypothetical protein